MRAQEQKWGGRIGVILAVAGSAVGLGNFLRFPGNAAENGGGAFMIPYFCALILLGIPIGWAEWTIGRYGGRKGFHSGPAILGVIGKGGLARSAGMLTVLIPLAVYFYYVLIESWCLYYFWMYVTGAMPIAHAEGVEAQVEASRAFFAATTGQAGNGVLLADGGHEVLFAFVATVVLNVYYVYRGLSGGIEFVCKWALPVMAVLGLIVLARVLTLDPPPGREATQTVAHGLGFMWNPDFDKLGNFKTWVAAAGQIFFSLSVGFGVIINYASYLKRKDDVVLSGLTASATNEFYEVALGGLITIPAAVVFCGVAVTGAAASSSFDLGFNTLPVVFAQMPAGDVFGAMFFGILFLAAITSSLSMLQPTMAFFEEALGVSRRVATAVTAAWGLLGSAFVIWFSEGLTALGTIDFWIGSFGILLMGAAQIICFSWVFGAERGIAEAHVGAHLRIPRVFRFVMKYVSPVYLIVIVAGFCWFNLPDSEQDGETVRGEISRLLDSGTAQLTLGLLAATAIALLVILAVGVRRWRAEGRDLDGALPPADGPADVVPQAVVTTESGH